MAEQPREGGIYFVFGAVLGAVAGGLVGLTVYEAFRPPVFWFAAIGALVFGPLGLVFKEDVVEFFPWLS